jgi:hypothetical protein
MASQHPYYNTGYDGTPVVVQGTVVQGIDAKYKQEVAVSSYGEKQKGKCNDVVFAILFYAHLGVMGWVTATYAPVMMSDVAGSVEGYGNRMLQDEGTMWSNVFSSLLTTRRRLQDEDNGNNDGEVTVDMASIIAIIGISALSGFILSAFFLGVMMRFAQGLIKFALWFNIITPLLMGILALLVGVIPFALFCLMAAAFTAYYAYHCWNRIPFAAANMQCAVTAVKANFGLTFFAYNSLILSFGWSVWWSIATASTVYVTSGCSADGGCESDPNGFALFGFLVSYFWTMQVIKNVVHTTVAGTVGTWWFHPSEASSCCSKAVCDSFIRSITWSFGSICFGSLIVAIIQALRELAKSAREDGDSMLMCCADCILGCIESLVEYFNQWAYVYVALYGYSFMEAGRNVMTLFRQRGWTSIITDMLIDGVLVMCSLAIGAITGIIAFIVAQASNLYLDGAEGPSAFL